MPLPTLTELRTAVAAAPENGLTATTALPGYPDVNYNKGPQVTLAGYLRYEVFLYPSAGFGAGPICTVDDVTFITNDTEHDLEVEADTATDSYYSQSAGADVLYGPSSTPIPVGVDLVDIDISDFGPIDFAAGDDYWHTHGVTSIPSGYVLDTSPIFTGVRPRRSAWVTPPAYSFQFEVPDASQSGPLASGGYDMPATPSDARGILEAIMLGVEGTYIRLDTDPSPDDTDWTALVEAPPVPSGATEIGAGGFRAGFSIDVSRSNFLSSTPNVWDLFDWASPSWAVFVALPDRPPVTLPPGAIGYELEDDGLLQPDRLASVVMDLLFEATNFSDPSGAIVSTDVTIYRHPPADLAGAAPADVDAAVLPAPLDPALYAHHLPAATAATKPVAAVVSIDETTTGTLHATIPVSSDDWNNAEFALGAVSSWALSDTRPPLPAVPVPGRETGNLWQWIDCVSAVLSGVYQPRRYRFLYPAVTPPQRQFPRDDGLGISTRRSWPPPTSKQYGQRRGASATYQ